MKGSGPAFEWKRKSAAKAARSGGPWIDTNSGFLRFVRAATDAPVWIGVRPPAGSVVTPERYMQAISDAAIVGARWIVALDEDFQRRLLAGEAPAVRGWQRMVGILSYFESHNDWRAMKPAGELAILQDVESGALLVGGVLDMIAVKHTPVRPVPTHSLDSKSMQGTKMAVNVDPGAMGEAQKQTIRAWTRTGGTLLNGPATWKFPAPKAGQITLSDADVKTLDEIWKEMNSMTGRRNLGVRLFERFKYAVELHREPRSCNERIAACELLRFPSGERHGSYAGQVQVGTNAVAGRPAEEGRSIRSRGRYGC